MCLVGGKVMGSQRESQYEFLKVLIKITKVDAETTTSGVKD